MPGVQDGPLRDLVGYNLRRASNAIQSDLAQTLEPFGLRMITYSALSLIAENPGLSQSQLAAALSIERPNLVVVVDQLENADLITRDRVPTDRRTYALNVTDEGRALLGEATRAVVGHERNMLKRLSAEEELALKSILRKIEG